MWDGSRLLLSDGNEQSNDGHSPVGVHPEFDHLR